MRRSSSQLNGPLYYGRKKERQTQPPRLASHLRRLASAHLVALAELQPQVHEVFHPNVAVGVLVADVEHLLQLLEEVKELLLVGENMPLTMTMIHDVRERE